MRIQRYIAAGLAWLSLASCLGASLAWAQDRAAAIATDPLSNINRMPAALERTVGRLRIGLEVNGFAVARGYWTLWGVDDCKYPLQTLGYCYGNNPTAPYVLAVLPLWKDEYVDPKFYHILNNPPRNMTSTYRLDPREALVIAAQLPPPARYFGIGSNVFTREIAFNPDDPIYQSGKVTDPLLLSILFGASPDPLRRMMVASIGNSTNNVVIEQQTGQTPWNRPAYFVIASDAGMAAKMTDALVRAGASSSDIFTEPVSPDLVKVGLNSSADDLITYIRYALPVDKAAGERWRQELPLTIFRVRDVSSRHYNNPLPVPTYTERNANFDETTMEMTDDFTNLQDAVRTAWGESESEAPLLPFFSAYNFLDLIGQHCLGYPDPARGPMDCLGDSQDADYQISASGQIDGGQVIAVLGTLSTETGNATYTSLSVNWFPELVGVANIDDTELKGSAADFAGALQHNSDLFYVYYVARDCTGLAHCHEISTTLVPTGGTIKFIQRNYVNPGSSNGPDPNKILNPVAIVLDGQNRPVM
jgi:hypothetical protein